MKKQSRKRKRPNPLGGKRGNEKKRRKKRKKRKKEEKKKREEKEMKITFHGGAREVGRSCYEVKTSRHKFLLDCGLKITPDGTEYPIGFDTEDEVKDIDGVFITHAHLDHTGALPWMEHKGMNCPVYCTKATKDLTRILLKDAYKVGKIQHHHLGYDKIDISDVMGFMKLVKVKEKGESDDVNFEFFDAGHIPGSAMVYLEIDGVKLLYTGDVKTKDTNMHKGASLELPEVDVLITESTYGTRDHPDREREEHRLIESIKETLQRGGSAIVPVFGVGRAQEVLMILRKLKTKVPIYLDGMGVRVTDTILANAQSIADKEELESALRKVRTIKGYKERESIARKQGVFLTTSGMLTGGPVITYLKALHHDEKSSVLLTGYQGENTNGRMLLETGNLFLDGEKKKVSCQVEKFDFSAHDGLAELKNMVRTLKPRKVVFVHGDEEAVKAMEEWALALGFDAAAPGLGDVIEIRGAG